ncbi:MAG: class I SAM-dependent methyltransferase [Deltaproteobacteria bacterium]|nr:class I SAM-dependent methyltransferase [Deltaproteobacteria bacterium]
MTEQSSKWQTKELAQTFLEGVRGAIPAADFQLAVLGKIVSMWQPRPTRILDLGCGDGALGRLLLDAHPSAQIFFADFSEPMLEALRKRIAGKRRGAIIQVDFATPAWTKEFAAQIPFDVIVSGFAIHHQPDERKKELYGEIFGLLSAGGVFLNLEHVSSATPAAGALFDSFFVDHLLRFHQGTTPGKTRQEIEQAYYQRPDKKENILAPVDTQCQWLRGIGFQDVDCFFKVFELALFGGRKAASPEREK